MHQHGWLLVFALAGMASGEIVDRIAVSLGTEVITETQILEEIRVTSFLNREPPDFGAANKKQAAERLIEQALMRRDMEFSHYPMPPMSEAGDLEKQIRERYSSPADFEAEAKRLGVKPADLKLHLWWQVTILQFIDYRFRPAIQVPGTEIAQFYEKKRLEWEQQGLTKIPTLEESRAGIEKILTEQRVDQAVDRWLGDARTRLDILYHAEAFQ